MNQEELAQVQNLAEAQGLKVVNERGYLTLKSQDRTSSGGQSVPANEDGVEYLKCILKKGGDTDGI